MDSVSLRRTVVHIQDGNVLEFLEDISERRVHVEGGDCWFGDGVDVADFQAGLIVDQFTSLEIHQQIVMPQEVCSDDWRLNIGNGEDPNKGTAEANIDSETFGAICLDCASIRSEKLVGFHWVEEFAWRRRNNRNVSTGVNEILLGGLLIVDMNSSDIYCFVQGNAGYFRQIYWFGRELGR